MKLFSLVATKLVRDVQLIQKMYLLRQLYTINLHYNGRLSPEEESW